MSQSQGHNERELENILNELGEFNNERNEVENGDSILQGGAKDCEEDIKKFELKNINNFKVGRQNNLNSQITKIPIYQKHCNDFNSAIKAELEEAQ